MATVSFRAAQSANKRKTFLLLGAMGALTWLVLLAIFTYLGTSSAAIVPFAVGLTLISVWGSYYGSDKLVLTMTGARQIQESDNPKLFGLLCKIQLQMLLQLVATLNMP
jgi:heat shock protein HtpX